MKRLIANYTFNKATKKITFLDYGSIDLGKILLITDLSAGNVPLFNFTNAQLTGTVSGNVLTLTFNTNTSSYNNSDRLQIYYEDPDFKNDVDLLYGENAFWRRLATRRKYVPVNINAFSTNGGSIWVQAKRLLGGVIINKPSSAGVVLNLYNDYYTSGGGQRLASIDCSIPRQIDYMDMPFSTACFYKMPDPGGGTPPDVTILVA